MRHHTLHVSGPVDNGYPGWAGIAARGRNQPRTTVSKSPEFRFSPNQPAMVRFTSGSTGKPKRTLRTHRQLLYGVWQYVTTMAAASADSHALAESLSASTGSRHLLPATVRRFNPHPRYAAGRRASPNPMGRDTRHHRALSAYGCPACFVADADSGHASLPDVRIVHVGSHVTGTDAEQFVQRFADGAVLVCRYAMSEIGSLTHFLVDCDTRLQDDTVRRLCAARSRDSDRGRRRSATWGSTSPVKLLCGN